MDTDLFADVIAAANWRPYPYDPKTDNAHLPRELRPVLDPYPFHRDERAERNLLENRGLHRIVYTARVLSAYHLARTMRELGWREVAPMVFETSFATLMLRTTTQPNGALIIKARAAYELYNAQNPNGYFQWRDLPPADPEAVA
jgi:hypothetical protein